MHSSPKKIFGRRPAKFRKADASNQFFMQRRNVQPPSRSPAAMAELAAAARALKMKKRPQENNVSVQGESQNKDMEENGRSDTHKSAGAQSAQPHASNTWGSEHNDSETPKPNVGNGQISEDKLDDENSANNTTATTNLELINNHNNHDDNANFKNNSSDNIIDVDRIGDRHPDSGGNSDNGDTDENDDPGDSGSDLLSSDNKIDRKIGADDHGNKVDAKETVPLAPADAVRLPAPAPHVADAANAANAAETAEAAEAVAGAKDVASTSRTGKR